jgi:hypothetical protein
LHSACMVCTGADQAVSKTLLFCSYQVTDEGVWGIGTAFVVRVSYLNKEGRTTLTKLLDLRVCM